MAGGYISLFAPWLGGAGAIPEGVATYTLTADAGAYTLTGESVTFPRSYVLNATLGDYTLTGQPISFVYSGAPTDDYSPPWKHIYVISKVRMIQQVKLVLKHI